MSEQHPECPLYNHLNCKELHNRKVCAIVRKDKKCFKKLHKSAKKAKKQPATKRLPWTEYQDTISYIEGFFCNTFNGGRHEKISTIFFGNFFNYCLCGR
jgi:hypothetical protein